MKRAIAALILLFACSKHEAPPPSQVTDSSPVPKPIEGKTPKVPHVDPIVRDLHVIRENATLNLLFTFNSTGYFIYRGETMGYEYELLNMFARESKLRLRPIVIRDSAVLYEKLNCGEGDIAAAQLVATTNETEVATTDTLYSTAPVLVQRNSDATAAPPSPAVATAVAREERRTKPAPIEVHARLISNPRELAGERVHMPRNSPYRQNLVELNDEVGDTIEVVEVDDSSDRLMQETSEGAIAYTVAAENVAKLKTDAYANLLLLPTMGPSAPIVWGVRTNAPQLLASLNAFIAAKKKAGLLGTLYRKYFLDRRGFQTRITSQYLAGETGTLSPYDAWFREYAKMPGWDWRLVAAQAFQESRFNARARSWAGATGLMQIMPQTARQMRVDPNDPRASIEGACRYIWQLDEIWKSSIRDESERIKFILGSYNVGLGHVQDAVRLAQKNGDDAVSWRDVGYWLIRKSQRAVYNDPVVKHGYARGTEPVAYVDSIIARWDNYKEFVKPELVPPPVTIPVATPSRR